MVRFQFLVPIIDRDSSERRAKWRVPREAAVITPRYRRALIRRDEIINLRYLDHPQESDDDDAAAAVAAPYVPYGVQTRAANIRAAERLDLVVAAEQIDLSNLLPSLSSNDRARRCNLYI